MHKAYLTNLAAEFEAYLGDPHDPGSRMPFSRILELDEAGQYPYSFVSQLRRWGTHEYLKCRPLRAAGGRATWKPASS